MRKCNSPRRLFLDTLIRFECVFIADYMKIRLFAVGEIYYKGRRNLVGDESFITEENLSRREGLKIL